MMDCRVVAWPVSIATILDEQSMTEDEICIKRNESLFQHYSDVIDDIRNIDAAKFVVHEGASATDDHFVTVDFGRSPETNVVAPSIDRGTESN